MDVWQACNELRRIARPDTRIIITYFNYLWHPILLFAERLRLKLVQGHQNWLSLEDIENLLHLHGFETVKRGNQLLFDGGFPMMRQVSGNQVNSYSLRPMLSRNQKERVEPWVQQSAYHGTA